MAKMLLKTINLTIDKENYNPIIAKQADTGRYLLFQILNNGVPFVLSGKNVRVHAVKKDGTKIYNDLTIIDGPNGICELKLTSQILFFPGWLKLDLTIYDGTDTISLIPFTLDIIASIRDDAAIESTNEFSALSISLKKVDTWNKEFEDKSDKLEELYTPRLNGLNVQLADIPNKTYITDKAKQVDLEVERQRVDSFTNLSEGSTTGDAELIDGRVGADGITYTNIGGAIRSKTNNDVLLNSFFTLESGSYTSLCIKENNTTRCRFSEPIIFNQGDTIVNKNRTLIKYSVLDVSNNEIIVNIGSSSSGYTFTSKRTVVIYCGYVDNRVISDFSEINLNIMLLGNNATKKFVEENVKYNYTGKIKPTNYIDKSSLLNDALGFELGTYDIIGNKVESTTRVRCNTSLFMKTGDKIINSNTTLIKYAMTNLDNGAIIVNIGTKTTEYVFTSDTTVLIYGGYQDNRVISDLTEFKNTLLIYGTNSSKNLIDKLVIENYTGTSEPTENPYANVKWTMVGDSISDTSNSYASKRYFNFISDDLGIKPINIRNLAVSGSGYLRTASNFMSRVASMPIDTQLVTIFGGGNDCNISVNYDFGTYKDTGIATVGGAINTLIDMIIDRCPFAKIGIISPTPWSIYAINIDNNRMYLLNNLLKEVCDYRGISFLDLYHSSNIIPTDLRHNSLFYESNILSNVHPKMEGHKMFYPKIREFIKSLI